MVKRIAKRPAEMFIRPKARLLDAFTAHNPGLGSIWDIWRKVGDVKSILICQ
jgi:hypothetical protein